MALPPKQYYSFEEVAARWGITMRELCDHALEGTFPVHTWIGKVQAETGNFDDNGAWVMQASLWFNNHAIVLPVDLREVFRQGHSLVGLYKAFNIPGAEYVKIVSDKPYAIEPRDLVISRLERDRMEEEYDLCLDQREPKPAAPSFPGRPSVMRELMEEMKRHHREGALQPTLTRESEYLHAWARQNITHMQIPTPKAIANGVRKDYRELADA